MMIIGKEWSAAANRKGVKIVYIRGYWKIGFIIYLSGPSVAIGLKN